MFEAVWFNDGKEVFSVDPVVKVIDEHLGAKYVEVENGYSTYRSGDGIVPFEVDGFLVREKQA